MAIIAFREIFDGDAKFQVKGFAREYERVFRCETDFLQYGSISILAAVQAMGLLPFLMSPYVYPNGEFDTGARLISYDAKREHDLPLCWLLTCKYSSQLDDLFRRNTPEMARDSAQNNNQQFNDPFAQPFSVKRSGAKYQKVATGPSLIVTSGTGYTIAAFGSSTIAVTVTPTGYTPTAADVGQGVILYGTGALAAPGNACVISSIAGGAWVLAAAAGSLPTGSYPTNAWSLGGDGYTNSAFARFDPAPELDDSRFTLTIVRNELYIDDATIVAYEDAVATDVFWGELPGQPRIDSIEADSAYENGIYFQKVTYTIQFRREGWGVTILDQGLQGWRTVGGVQSFGPFPDPQTGAPVTAPVLLDGTGQRLAANGLPFYRKFAGYKGKPFGPLGLPFNIPQH